jgi:hypothetical protein
VHISIQHERTGVKIMVLFEDEYRAYRGALAATIRILRPNSEVVTAEPGKIGGVVERFGPDIVIGSRFEDEDLDGVRAWIKFSLDPTQSTKVRVRGEYSEMINPTLDKLLAIIDDVEPLTRVGDH